MSADPLLAIAPCFEALGAGRLALPFCSACSRHFFYPRDHCPRCFSSAWAWRDTPSRRGVVLAVTSIHRGSPAAEDEPVLLALVRLDVEVVLLARFSGHLVVGDAVVVDLEASAEASRFVVSAELVSREG